ncbi:MAG: WD40 repeat domain-containing protein [Actinomycetaceae bacterium]|nr:WD40 repeat domain-containing protein [Actinomycetaceae bacterium]
MFSFPYARALLVQEPTMERYAAEEIGKQEIILPFGTDDDHLKIASMWIDDTNYLVISRGQEIWLEEPISGQKIGQPIASDLGTIFSLAPFLLDGQPLLLFTLYGGKVLIADPVTGEVVDQVPHLGAHQNSPATVFSDAEGNTFLAVVTHLVWLPRKRHEAEVRLVDLHTMQMVGKLKSVDPWCTGITSLEDTSGNPKLALGFRSGHLEIWDIANKNRHGWPHRVQDEELFALHFFRTADQTGIIVTGGEDGTIDLWDQEGEHRFTLPLINEGFITSVATWQNPHGTTFLVATDTEGNIHFWPYIDRISA